MSLLNIFLAETISSNDTSIPNKSTNSFAVLPTAPFNTIDIAYVILNGEYTYAVLNWSYNLKASVLDAL